MTMRTVKLFGTHTHNGQTSWAGQTVEMSEAEAKWYNETLLGAREEVQNRYIRSEADESRGSTD